ncbi:MAG: N-acetyl-gamma-glutamyl-phosphate reductase [Nitrospirae bacterium]|uniref:N-acetyl-gamma-glutamyl-phosphate reductase n=1 Tax=Candidatus Magnetobacterium casense TaxID=1455061 RepID=UPI00058FF5B8|nr:N-acetyl-gamma-glutamyl-phosphate reductase [Candidatus Magnetobacterium casensis]MBF0339070.1 N-acetyl-gamma-glutamyl-phosphate reductase [Nitrospirota bacterium]
MLKVVICGGSGYTGSELMRLLINHPDVLVTAITADRYVGKTVTELFPHLYDYTDYVFEPLEKEALLEKGDVFFTALPHATSQEVVDHFHRNGKMVIDLSADYRLKDHAVYSQWYGTTHHYPQTLAKAVYGLPEVHRESIKGASLVANPGCYPTSVLLALYPALKHNLVDVDHIVIDSKSGVSGAGRKGEVALSFCEVNGGFSAYGVATHRHTPEIEQGISLSAQKPVTVSFTPHLLPVNRGILSTVYATLGPAIDLEEVLSLYEHTYENDPFVIVMDKGKFPDIKNVRGTNFCQIGIAIDRKNTLIIVSVIDNLIKGASGQAVQNMNIMCGFDETVALKALSVLP